MNEQEIDRELLRRATKKADETFAVVAPRVSCAEVADAMIIMERAFEIVNRKYGAEIFEEAWTHMKFIIDQGLKAMKKDLNELMSQLEEE